MSQTRRTAGVSVLSTSRRLATSSVWRLDTPVTLPPGRASWPTMPAPTGSPTRVNTMGTLSVASLAAWVAASWLVKIRSTPALTRASAAAGIAQLSLGEADVERHVAAVHEAEFFEPGLEPFDGRMACRPRRVEDADAERARGFL